MLKHVFIAVALIILLLPDIYGLTDDERTMTDMVLHNIESFLLEEVLSTVSEIEEPFYYSRISEKINDLIYTTSSGTPFNIIFSLYLNPKHNESMENVLYQLPENINLWFNMLGDANSLFSNRIESGICPGRLAPDQSYYQQINQSIPGDVETWITLLDLTNNNITNVRFIVGELEDFVNNLESTLSAVLSMEDFLSELQDLTPDVQNIIDLMPDYQAQISRLKELADDFVNNNMDRDKLEEFYNISLCWLNILKRIDPDNEQMMIDLRNASNLLKVIRNMNILEEFQISDFKDLINSYIGVNINILESYLNMTQNLVSALPILSQVGSIHLSDAIKTFFQAFSTGISLSNLEEGKELFSGYLLSQLTSFSIYLNLWKSLIDYNKLTGADNETIKSLMSEFSYIGLAPEDVYENYDYYYNIINFCIEFIKKIKQGFDSQTAAGYVLLKYPLENICSGVNVSDNTYENTAVDLFKFYNLENLFIDLKQNINNDYFELIDLEYSLIMYYLHQADLHELTNSIKSFYNRYSDNSLINISDYPYLQHAYELANQDMFHDTAQRQMETFLVQSIENILDELGQIPFNINNFNIDDMPDDIDNDSVQIPGPLMLCLNDILLLKLKLPTDLSNDNIYVRNLIISVATNDYSRVKSVFVLTFRNIINEYISNNFNESITRLLISEITDLIMDKYLSGQELNQIDIIITIDRMITKLEDYFTNFFYSFSLSYFFSYHMYRYPGEDEPSQIYNNYFSIYDKIGYGFQTGQYFELGFYFGGVLTTVLSYVFTPDCEATYSIDNGLSFLQKQVIIGLYISPARLYKREAVWYDFDLSVGAGITQYDISFIALFSWNIFNLEDIIGLF